MSLQFRQLHRWSCRVGPAAAIALLNVACAEPGALQITPCEITLGRGGMAIVRAVDADGFTPPHVVWKSENPAIAEVVADNDAGDYDDDVQIRARGTGRTCISATVLFEVATTCVTVLETPSVPAGHLRWAVTKSAVLPSAQIADITPARRDDMPLAVAMFVVEIDWGIDRNYRDQRVTLRGLEADGRERWRQHIDGVIFRISIADPKGGVVLVFDEPASNTSSVRRFDGTQGAQSWRYDSRGQVPARCLQCLSSVHGIRPDGTILLLEVVGASASTPPGITAFDLIALDGATGKLTSRLPLPTSQVITSEGHWVREPEVSPMVIEDDGTAAVAIGTTSTDTVRKRVRADIKLLRIAPDGMLSWQTIREHERDGEWIGGFTPRALTPNGQGALLVTWFERDPGLSHALATRTRVLDWDLDIIIQTIDGLGDGYGVTADGDVVRLDITTGRQLGATIPVGKGARVLSGRLAGGVIVRDSTDHVRHYAADGTLLKKLELPSNGQDSWRADVVVGEHFIETEGTNLFAFHIDGD